MAKHMPNSVSTMFKIGPHEDETPLQAKIRELNDMSQNHPQRDVRSEEVFTEIYLLVLEIKQLAIDNGVSLCWDPFGDFVIKDLKNHHLPRLCGGPNNGKGGFFNTEQEASGTTITTEEVRHTIVSGFLRIAKSMTSSARLASIVNILTLLHWHSCMREYLIDEGCRLGVTTGYECFQFTIIHRKILMRCDGTAGKINMNQT